MSLHIENLQVLNNPCTLTNSYVFTQSTIYSGVPLTMVFQASDEVTTLTVEEIKLVNSSGYVYKTIVDILSYGDNTFAATNFIPPDVAFQWQIVGKDKEGYRFSRISDTAVGVSDIDLLLGMYYCNLLGQCLYVIHSLCATRISL